jgi:RNA polymerase sigma-70 factor (ECF subfamily)
MSASDDRSAGLGQATPSSMLVRARTNDPAAWRRLVELYTPLVRYWCGRGGVRQGDAEDVAQEVFAAAASGLPRFRHDRPGDTFRGWLRGVTRNCVLSHFRRSRGRPLAEGGSDAWQNLAAVPDPLADEATNEEAEVGQLYRSALELVRGEFEARTWQAFWRTAVDGRSPAALSAEMDMTPAAIRQAKSRVLRRLKEELGDLLD